jgi:hypothetical protein
MSFVISFDSKVEAARRHRTENKFQISIYKVWGVSIRLWSNDMAFFCRLLYLIRPNVAQAMEFFSVRFPFRSICKDVMEPAIYNCMRDFFWAFWAFELRPKLSIIDVRFHELHNTYVAEAVIAVQRNCIIE